MSLSMDTVLNPQVLAHCTPKLTNILSMDCEFVNSGLTQILARVSIVNFYGQVVMDTLVAPSLPVTDWLTHITGITEDMVRKAPSYQEVNKKVIDMISGRTIVGHSLHCDIQKFSSLWRFPTPVQVIEISEFEPYMRLNKTKIGLKQLAKDHLNAKIQESAHSSIIDA